MCVYAPASLFLLLAAHKEIGVSDSAANILEEMASFFNQRADTYDAHMHEVVGPFDSFYETVSGPIRETDEPIAVLDLGSGTGLELPGVFRKAPNARVTAVDLSEAMTRLLLEKHDRFREQISVVIGSFLTVPLPESHYDYAISVMAMHHLLCDQKRELYGHIRKALVSDGVYIEGDYVELPDLEQRWRRDYLRLKEEHHLQHDGLYHYDIPCSLETEERLFREAGFGRFQVFWHVETAAIYRVDGHAS